MPRPKTLTNSALVKEIRNLVKRGNALEVRLVQHLAEFLERELHLAFGVRSAFAYLTAELGFSRDVALKRIRAARAILIRPEALEQLRQGRLSVSSLAVLGPAIEIPELYEFALGRSKRQVELKVSLVTKKRSPRGEGSRVSLETPDGAVAMLHRMPPELVAKIATVAELLARTTRGSAEASLSETLSASMDIVICAIESELRGPPPDPSSPGRPSKEAEPKRETDSSSNTGPTTNTESMPEQGTDRFSGRPRESTVAILDNRETKSVDRFESTPPIRQDFRCGLRSSPAPSVANFPEGTRPSQPAGEASTGAAPTRIPRWLLSVVFRRWLLPNLELPDKWAVRLRAWAD